MTTLRKIFVLFLFIFLGLVQACQKTDQREIPNPKSQIIDRFVLQKDSKYAYSMLRPGNWNILDTGGRRIYVPSDTNMTSQMSLSAINFHILANKSEEEQMVQQWLVFKDNPTLDGWTKGMVRANTKSRNTILIVIALLSLITGVILRVWFFEQPVAAADGTDAEITSAMVTETVLIEENITDNATAEVAGPEPTAPEYPNLSQSVNGITVRVENPRLEKERISIDVCFDLPSNSDWTIFAAELRSGSSMLRFS